MTHRTRAFWTASALAFLLAGCDFFPVAPVDITGLRSFDGGATVIELGFPAVKPPILSSMEDRTVAHFDATIFSGKVPPITLMIPVRNMDAPDLAGDFEIYLFAGDGDVSTDEWNAGRLIHTFEDLPGGDQFLELDVTDLFQTAVDRGYPFVSFGFRAIDDRFGLGRNFGAPGETVLVVHRAGRE